MKRRTRPDTSRDDHGTAFTVMRSWTMIAYAFLHIAACNNTPKKKTNGPRLAANLPAVRHAILDFSLDYGRSDVALSKMDLPATAA